jgi:hypothetical protein
MSEGPAEPPSCDRCGAPTVEDDDGPEPVWRCTACGREILRGVAGGPPEA